MMPSLVRSYMVVMAGSWLVRGLIRSKDAMEMLTIQGVCLFASSDGFPMIGTFIAGHLGIQD